MIINGQTLDLAFRGFNTIFSDALGEAPSHYDKIAMVVPSSSRDETYGWLGNFPAMREWVGQRQVKAFEAHGFTIRNRTFESTVEVNRVDFEDDRLGVFKPAFAEMGQAAARHPDEMIFSLLKSGFNTTCYDGQFFFDVDHPVTGSDDQVTSVANTDGGAGPGWFLLDTSRSVRPLIWQERMGYEFQSLNGTEDEYVFRNDKFLYGIRARVNAGFGLWQFAWGSKQPLTAANYAAARAAMMGFKTDGGRVLGVTPNVLVVPPALESDALSLLNTETNSGGGSNPWKGTASLIVSPYLS
ncbi:hypothetical protein FBT96_04405 [Rhodobacter capsulatus]|uniref:Bacteriophage Mu GpT domain-containing protein n=1 Tax=Rhodobacter capsulatus TaxID=1061 RepID=A0A4U1JWA4_RHOCA|nr:Mu-like prophage major head subunit gpT family protein [Rhodobacter capsulatus]TKD23059.1 hypothetical protein FBT96_04405 [Rhodobacter capsulatus]